MAMHTESQGKKYSMPIIIPCNNTVCFDLISTSTITVGSWITSKHPPLVELDLKHTQEPNILAMSAKVQFCHSSSKFQRIPYAIKGIEESGGAKESDPTASCQCTRIEYP